MNMPKEISCPASAPGTGTTLTHAFRFTDKTTHLEPVRVAKHREKQVVFLLGDYSALFRSLILSKARRRISSLEWYSVSRQLWAIPPERGKEDCICSGYMAERGGGVACRRRQKKSLMIAPDQSTESTCIEPLLGFTVPVGLHFLLPPHTNFKES